MQTVDSAHSVSHTVGIPLSIYSVIISYNLKLFASLTTHCTSIIFIPDKQVGVVAALDRTRCPLLCQSSSVDKGLGIRFADDYRQSRISRHVN